MRYSMARSQGGQAVNIEPEDSELDNYSRSFDELEDELNNALKKINRLHQLICLKHFGKKMVLSRKSDLKKKIL